MNKIVVEKRFFCTATNKWKTTPVHTFNHQEAAEKYCKEQFDICRANKERAHFLYYPMGNTIQLDVPHSDICML